MRCFPFAALLALACCFPSGAQTYKGATLVEASLIADATAIVPGQPLRVGVRLRMAPHWHTYWQYSGDAGIPTEVRWKLPAGFASGPIEWPLPEAQLQADADLLTYGYEDDVVLLQTLRPPADLAPGAKVQLAADVSWLVCEEICIPGKASLTLELPVAERADPANADTFARWEARLPSSNALPFPVTWSRSGKMLAGRITPPAGTTAVEFFPLPGPEQLIGHPTVRAEGGAFIVEIESESDLRGVLAVRDGKGTETGWEITAVPTAATAAPSPIAAGQTSPQTGAFSPLLLALAGGFLGGILLNLMPCVLPVISLKIFGFVQQAGQSRRRIALHGVAFSAGIFTWFLGLGAVIVGLKAGGSQVTWAFQFQNPWFILAISTLVFVFALNLFGVFELTLPGRATTKLSAAGAADGYAGSFFSGVFATLLATPCTGPFLGSALGFAFAQSAPVTLLLFASISAGMALPYLALSLQPAWMRFLPRPGVWMERLKQFMGFPLLATLLWLLYVIGGQRGPAAIVWAAAFLLVLGLALWIYGAASAPGVKPVSRLRWQCVAVLVAVAGGWFFADLFASERAPAPGAPAKQTGGIAWVPFSQAEVDRLLAEGKPVFIDFTADWCLSCKYNERTAIDTAAVRAKIAELGIVPVKADWTNANPEITAALDKFGRVGVPFYVLYPAGKAASPITLPEFLTESMVLEALAKAR